MADAIVSLLADQVRRQELSTAALAAAAEWNRAQLARLQEAFKPAN